MSSWMEQTDLRIHIARYEDLVEDPRPRARRIPRPARPEERDGFRERRAGAAAFFFRAGGAGQWRTALTSAQVQAIVDAHGEVMARHGYLREREAT